MRPSVALAFVASVLATTLAPAPASAASDVPDDSFLAHTAVEERQICRDAIVEAERRHGIPLYLLAAIARVETGRWHRDEKVSFAWPWTVTAEGVGRFFPSKAAAIAHVHKLRKRGIQNIDVGCMQVNLYHHPNAFPSLDAAFEPASNIDYAARFLLQLRDQTRSWQIALAHYHSTNLEKNVPYRNKVNVAWAEERRIAHAEAVEQRRQEAARLRAENEAQIAQRRADYQRRRAEVLQSAAAWRARVQAAQTNQQVRFGRPSLQPSYGGS